MSSISAECPICFERYSGPIFLCETGHSICGQCTSQVTQCPTCRAPMTRIRNFGLEAMVAESAHSSTSSRNFGCYFKECSKKFQRRDEIEPHQRNCEFRDVICDSCNTSIPYGDYIYHLIQVHKVQEKSTELHIGINLDKIKSKDGEKYILYNENGENLLVNMMVQNGLFYIWIEHLKSNANSNRIGGKFEVKFCDDQQTKVLSLACPLLGFRSTSKNEVLEHYFPISLKQMENFQRAGRSINSIIISSDGTNNPEFEPESSNNQEYSHNLKSQVKNFGREFSSAEGASAPPELNLAQIEIKDAEFRLTEDNVEILASLTENNTVTDLKCVGISAKNIPEITRKFKAIQKLYFWHEWDFKTGKCVHFNTIQGDGCDDCIFKLPQMNTLENLKELYIQNLEINTGVNIGPKNLPTLKILKIYTCNIRGNLVDTILTRLFALEEIGLWANTPLLEKKDVETLLRSKSLKCIYLNSNLWGRQVISGSFAPIGPDGKPFAKIIQNARIIFKRDSNTLPWKLTMIQRK